MGTANTVYIGVDPGLSGGMAYITCEGIVSVQSMPLTEKDIWMWFQSLALVFPARENRLVGVIEKVGGYIPRKGKGGTDGQPGSSMFKFGASYGGLRMAMIAAGIPFDEVPPKKWQHEMGVIGSKGETKSQFKNRLKAKAQQLYPEERITLATCDALLIARYALKTTTVKSYKKHIR